MVVTDNLKDFPAEQLAEFGVEALSPDAFTLAQIELDRDALAACLQTMAARRRHPPMTPGEVVESLSRFLPEAMARLRNHE